MVKKDIIAVLSATRRNKMDEVIRQLEELGFFEAPASIRHQNNYDGGLAEHSFMVYEEAISIRESLISYYPELEASLPLDSVAIATLLHDVCKSDVYHKSATGKYYKDMSGFPAGHGEKSVIMLLRMGLKLTDDEILAIRWHMGNHEAKEGSQEYVCMRLAMDKCPLLRVVLQADARASRKAIHIKEGENKSLWNTDLWIKNFRFASLQKDTEKQHSLRRKVYDTTLKAAMDGYYSLNEDTVITLPLNPDIAQQTVFCEKEIRPKEPTHEFDTLISVKGQDCLDLAHKLALEEGSDSVAVLNLASWKSPGGGVMKGAGAQEEYLFRCTDYFRSLYQYMDYAPQYNIVRNMKHSYPLNEQFGAVFSRGVTVFRGNEASGYSFLEKPWKVNFIAVAAHRNPQIFMMDGEPRLVPEEVTFMEDKVRSILRIALRNGQTTLVLGALGCGAFHNPPKHVAEIFKAVLAEDEFDGVFKAIYFAIIDDHNSNGNLAAFQKVFK